MPGTFFPPPTICQAHFFFPYMYRKTNEKKSVIFSVLISVQEWKRGVSLTHEH